MKENSYIIKGTGVVQKAEVGLSHHEDSIQIVMKENEYIVKGTGAVQKQK